MVKSLTDRFYSGVSRYAVNGFSRLKLNECLETRGVASRFYGSVDEARRSARETKS